MKPLACIAVMIVAIAYCQDAAAQVISPESVRAGSHLMPGERQLCRRINLGPNTDIDMTIDVTTKGNGILQAENIRFHVVDEHDDGATYQDNMAHVEFVDINGDGWKEIIVIGIVNYADDKTGALRATEPFTFIYEYNRCERSFRQTYKHASFSLEDGPHPHRHSGQSSVGLMVQLLHSYAGRTVRRVVAE